MLLTVRIASAGTAAVIGADWRVAVIARTPIVFAGLRRRPAERGLPLTRLTSSLRYDGSPPSPRKRGEGKAGESRASARLVARLGALRPASVPANVFRRRGVDQRIDLLLDRRNPVRHLVPLGAVPLAHESRVVTVVVL